MSQRLIWPGYTTLVKSLDPITNGEPAAPRALPS